MSLLLLLGGANVRTPDLGSGRLRVDVYDASGNKLAFGAITSVLAFSYTLELDRIGSFSMTLPAEEDRSGYLAQGYELRCYREGEGLVFRGIIDRLQWRASADDSLTLEVTGSSVARQLVWANTLLGRAFSGTTLASAMSTLLSGTGWSAGALDVPSTTALARFDGNSIWEAIGKLAEIFGLHVREDNLNKEIDVGAFGTVQSWVLQNVGGAVSPNLRDNTGFVPIAELEIAQESEELWNSIIPLGAGEGLNQVTLRYSNRSSPYAITSASGPDSQTYYYLEDASSVSSYGRRRKIISVKDAIQQANSSAGFQAAANALYDVAATWLGRHKDPQTVYAVKPVGLKHIVSGSPKFQVGDKVRTIFRGITKGTDGTVRAWKSVDSNLWVLGFTRTMREDGSDDWDLKVATVDRPEEDAATKVASVFSDMHALQVSLKNYTFQAPWVLQRTSIDASNTTRLTVKFDDNIALVHKVSIVFKVSALRSNVKDAAAGGSQTPTSSSGGSQTPTSSSGGSQTPTSSASGTHRHQMFNYVTNVAGSAETSFAHNVVSGSMNHNHTSATTDATASANPDPGHNHTVSGGTGSNSLDHTHTGTVALSYTTFQTKTSGGANQNFNMLTIGALTQQMYTYEAAADHTHTVTVAAHTHTVTISAHTHTVTIADHVHANVYGIYNASTPVNPAITITINGVSRTVALGGPWNTVGSEVEVDATAYFQSGSTEQKGQTTNTIDFGASVLCDIEAIVRADITRSALIPV